jgi:DnaJ domain
LQDKTTKFDRFHGRVGNGSTPCTYPGCNEAGDFRAPLRHGRVPGSNGPGDYQLLCLGHVREFNAGYDWFAGMSADQIAAAQSPTYTWPNETRAFSPTANVDAPPKWSDFHDPLDAINARFNAKMQNAASKSSYQGKILNPEERKALKTLGADENADRKEIRRAYSEKLRLYHPDRNGGDRSLEKKLQAVVDAWHTLRKSTAFA